MAFQDIEGQIVWKVHFSSAQEKVFQALTTDEGRGKFWAERTTERQGMIEFNILNYPKYNAKIIERKPTELFSIEYFGTTVTFRLSKAPNNETDLTLIVTVQDELLKREMTAGWVSVLMAMKAAVDFDVDLRNHDPRRVWENGYLDN